jgi:hypothetical protein
MEASDDHEHPVPSGGRVECWGERGPVINMEFITPYASELVTSSTICGSLASKFRCSKLAKPLSTPSPYPLPQVHCQRQQR